MAQSHWRRVMSWCVSFEENYAMAHREEEGKKKKKGSEDVVGSLVLSDFKKLSELFASQPNQPSKPPTQTDFEEVGS